MTKEQKKEITNISKKFASGFRGMIDSINGSGWMIVDPLSGYLNALGYENTLSQYEPTEIHCRVLIMTFKDGSIFIPAGGDLKPVNPKFKNWLWVSDLLPTKKIKDKVDVTTPQTS